MSPKVFISHASEDKQRFVVDFAQRLRANGVDAWLDQWEMKPGDSLVDKIFEEGLKDARLVLLGNARSLRDHVHGAGVVGCLALGPIEHRPDDAEEGPPLV